MNLVPQRDPQRYSQLTCHGHNCLSQMILNQFAACGAPGRVKEFREQSSRMSCIAYDDAVQHVPAAAGFAANSGLVARKSANCLTRVRPHSLTCSSAQPNICSNVRSPVARAAGSFRTIVSRKNKGSGNACGLRSAVHPSRVSSTSKVLPEDLASASA